MSALHSRAYQTSQAAPTDATVAFGIGGRIPPNITCDLKALSPRELAIAVSLLLGEARHGGETIH
jgi:hypothetical protein